MPTLDKPLLLRSTSCLANGVYHANHYILPSLLAFQQQIQGGDQLLSLAAMQSRCCVCPPLPTKLLYHPELSHRALSYAPLASVRFPNGFFLEICTSTSVPQGGCDPTLVSIVAVLCQDRNILVLRKPQPTTVYSRRAYLTTFAWGGPS